MERKQQVKRPAAVTRTATQKEAELAERLIRMFDQATGNQGETGSGNPRESINVNDEKTT